MPLSFSWTVLTDGFDWPKVVHLNSMATAIQSIITALGGTPQGTAADLETRLAKALSGAGNLDFATSTTLTISAGSITPTQNWHAVETEGAASSDDLDTIVASALTDGFLLVIRPSSDSHTVVITNAGNIVTGTGASITLDDYTDVALLIYSATLTKWLVMAAPITATSGGSSFWTSPPATPTRESNTTFSIPGDYSATTYPFGKKVVWKWTESSVVKCAMQSIPQTYGSSKTTFTIVGDTMASIDSGSLKYALVEAIDIILACFGSIDAVSTNQFGEFTAFEPYRVLGADVNVGTAGTTNSSTFDINKNGTTMFATKPTLASTVRYSPTPFTADNGVSLALGDQVTGDIDAVQTTVAVDAFLHLYLFPTKYLYMT